jgi:TP901 family phage tail tape measure protein
MAENRYTWELGLSASDLTKALQEVMGAVKSIDKALNDMGQTLQDAFDDFKQKAKPAVDEITAFGNSIGKIFKAVEKDIENISKSMRQADMSKWEKAADNYSLKIAKASKQLDEMKTKAAALTATDEERVKINQQIADTQERINRLMSEQQKMTSFAALQRQAKEVKDAYQQAGGAIRDISMVLGVASAAIISGIASAGQEFSQFEGKLVAFKAISKATAEEMGQFKQLARDMSEFGKTSTEVAALGVEFAKAGLSADEVAKAMKTVTVASVATQEDLMAMGMTVDSVRSQFGLSADEFDRVSNGLVLAANESKIGISDLAESYKYVGSTAKQTGQPLETINALLVMLGNSGIKASQAGNGLQNALLRLTDPAVRKALTGVGVDAVDAQGNVRKLTDIVIELQKGLGKMGKADQAAFLKDQFGEVAVNPLLALMAKTQDEIRKTEATMLNWSGVQDRVAKDMQKGLLYSFNQMKASVQVAQQVFIENMAPALEALTKFIKGAADAFVSLPKPLQFLIANGTLFVAGIGLIATAIGGIALAANTSIIALGTLGNALVAFTTGAPAVAGGVTGISTALTGVSAGFKALPGAAVTAGAGFGTAITGFLTAAAPLIALPAALYVAWEYNLGGFQDIFKNAMDAIGQALSDAGLGMVDWQTLWNATWITIQDTTFAVVAIIDQVLRGLFGSIDIVFRLISDAMAGNWSGVWKTIIDMGNSGASFIMKNFGQFFSKFGKLFQMSVRGLSEVWAGFIDNITNPTNPNAGAERIKAGLETIGTAVSRMGNLVGEAWNGAFDSVYKGAAGLADKGRELLKIDEITKRNEQKKKSTTQSPTVAPTETYDGKNAGDKAKKELDDRVKAEIDRVRQNAEEWEIAELKKAESVKDTGAAVEDLNKKIGDAAKAFAADRQGAIAFQKGVQDIGFTCAATTAKILEMAGVTKDLQGVVKNKNWVPDYDRLITAGLASKVALKDIQAGDLVLGYSKDPNSTRGHIGVAIDNKNVVHAGQGAGSRVGLRQLATTDTIQAAFSSSLAAGDDVHGIRLNEKAFKPDAINTKDIKEKQIKMDALKQQYDELIRLQGQLQAAGQKSEALDKRIAELRLATGKSEVDLIKAQKKAHEDAQKEIQKAIGETIKAIETDYKKLEDTIKNTLQSVAKSNQDMVDEFEDAQLSAAEKSAKYAKREIEAIDQTLADSYMGILNLDQEIKALQKQSGKNPSMEQQAQINELLGKRATLERALLKVQEDRDDREDLLAQKTRNAVTEEIKGITASGDSLKEFIQKLESSDDYLEKFTGGLGLTTEQANMLSEALAKMDFDASTQGAADDLEKRLANINKEQERFQSLVSGAAEAVAGLASAFGETGRNIAAAVRWTADFANNASKVSGIFQKLSAANKDGFSFEALLGDPQNIASVVGLITQAASLFYGSITEMINVNESTKQLLKDRVIEEANFTRETEIALQKDLLETRKRAGKATLDEQIDFVNKEADHRINTLKQQRENAKSKQGSGIFGLPTVEDAKNLAQELDRVARELFQNELDRQKQIRELRIAEEQKTKERLLAQDERYYSTQAALAAMTADKMDDIDVEFNQRRYEIMRDAEQAKKEAIESGASDTVDIEANRDTLLLQLDKETAKQRAEVRADALKAEKEAYFDHQEAVLNLQAETFDRSIELQRLALNREIALLDIEINALEAGSVERQRLETQKVDIILAANAAINQSIEQAGKDRAKELRSLAAGIAQLKAEISGNAGDLLAAGTRQSFADLFEQEQSQIEEARKKYQDAEEVITQIRAYYVLKREAESKKMLEEGIKTYRDKYASEQEKAIKAQSKPLQDIIDKEQTRIKAIDTQNAALERQNQLIDERFAKEQALFDQQDTSLFKQSLGGVDLAGGLTAGANYLANEDIINGTITDRTSRETQIRGLNELLDLQAQEADSKLKLEEISQVQYTEEMTRITLLRARAIQEAMLDAQNDKEKADLNKQFAEQYVAYQKLQKDAIDARRSLERRTNDELIASNNRLKDESQVTIDFNKAKIDELQANYDLRLRQIDEQIAGVSETSTGWIESLKAIAPTLAAQAQSAIESMKAIRDEFAKPVNLGNASGGSTASGSLMSSGGYAQSSSIQSRDKQMVDSYGSFSVQGSDGNWYLSTSQMQAAEAVKNTMPQIIGGLRAFAEGGVIPNYSHFENDGAVIRASAGERVLQTQFNRRMENMLQFFELPRGFAGMGAGGVNISQLNVANDVDLNKLEALFDKFANNRGSLGVKRWGINSLSRN